MLVINNRNFGRFWSVWCTITHRFGVLERYTRLPILGCVYLSVINTHNFAQFWSVSWTITHRFGVLERFTRFAIPGVRLCVGYQHSPFCPILVCHVDNYSLFWGPRAILTIHNPRGAFTCPSSTLIVLANSDPFRGLLLTFLGSRSDFHSC